MATEGLDGVPSGVFGFRAAALSPAGNGREAEADHEGGDGAFRHQAMEQAGGAGGFGEGGVDLFAHGGREADPGDSVRELKTFSPLLQFLLVYLYATSHCS